MANPRRIGFLLLLLAGIGVSAAAAQTSVRHVRVINGKDAIEVEIEASGRVAPETRVLTNPDRLVVDFPNATPGKELRSQSVNLGEINDVRYGLLQSKPPVTRIVLDLKSAQSYQVFPYGRTVMIKVMGSATPTAVATAHGGNAGVDYFSAEPAKRAGLVSASYNSGIEPVTAPQPKVEVTFHNGQLGIRANKATLSEVLMAVQQRTGADVLFSGGADQEQVVADLAPGPAAEVIARLLNGSRFNFLILNSAKDPNGLDRIILSPRGEAGAPAIAPMPNQNFANSGGDDTVEHDSPENAEVPQQPPQLGPSQPQPGNQPEVKTAPEDNIPD